MDPRAATSATAEPEISAKKRDAVTVTMARPPRIKPTSAVARLIRRREMPDAFMIAPARMKRGMAMRANLVDPEKRTMAALGSPPTPDVSQIAMTATTPRETAMGTLMRTSATSPRNMRRRITVTPPEPDRRCARPLPDPRLPVSLPLLRPAQPAGPRAPREG